MAPIIVAFTAALALTLGSKRTTIRQDSCRFFAIIATKPNRTADVLTRKDQPARHNHCQGWLL